MIKVILTLLLGALSLFASSANVGENPDLTMTWVGFASLFIFVVGYYFVAAEEKYAMDKAKPALFIGTFMFLLVAIYYALNGLDLNFVNTEVNHLILEIAGIFFFLYVAMTYIESLIHMGVFDRLKYNLVSKNPDRGHTEEVIIDFTQFNKSGYNYFGLNRTLNASYSDYKYNINNLDCANCARKLEESLNKNKDQKHW